MLTRQDYRHIVQEITGSLSMLDKDKTVLHFDGQPSVEKSGERERRQKDIEKRLKAIRIDLEKPTKHGRSIPRRVHRRIFNVFRPPPECLTQIQGELEAMGWKVCRCAFQADTYIGSCCQGSDEHGDCIAITRDNDLICFHGIWRVAMPVGPKRELMVFTKKDILEYLDLPSPLHLLLAAIVTSNDYGNGIRFCGIKTNVANVRG
ncbi:hypothetical protein BGZ65_004103 [Modicella reniformis]|uniref:Uncharacterized protein n=1 Tax=Modicella reniformis TaxID=1440133 RepID=A0A9P6IYS9_9FUNG|nr:hypothetical protein BGZ65_004103 [Modicella reniformis]